MSIVIGTTAQWAASSRVMARGQIGYDETADTLKVGDGVSLWAALPAIGAGGGAAWGTISGTLSAQGDLQTALNGKQATLVSGSNIKTVNGESLLGSTDIVISGGGGSPLLGWFI